MSDEKSEQKEAMDTWAETMRTYIHTDQKEVEMYNKEIEMIETRIDLMNELAGLKMRARDQLIRQIKLSQKRLMEHGYSL